MYKHFFIKADKLQRFQQKDINFEFKNLKLLRLEEGKTNYNKSKICAIIKTSVTIKPIYKKIPLMVAWNDNYYFAILEEDERDY